MKNRNRVGIVGDFMLDIYWEGQVNRISPEGPIPVVNVSKKKLYALGGAGNVAGNCAALGAEVVTFGVIGDDAEGRCIRNLLLKNQINVQYLLNDKCSKTVYKIRVLGNNQQIVRLDYNDPPFLRAELIDEVIENICKEIEKIDVFVISDYGKGICSSKLCSQVIAACNSRNKPVIVDPKGNDWNKYRGAELITPNLKELSVINRNTIENKNSDVCIVGERIYATLGIKKLLVTRSEKGMTLFEKRNIKHFFSSAKEVYDVSGAGDTVVASISTLYGKKTLDYVMKIATIAAGIAVGKKNTSIVTWKEIEQELNSKEMKLEKKIMKLEELLRQVEDWKNAGETIVFTNGCYDLIHRGHVSNLFLSASYGDHLIVAINSDRSVKYLKGNKRPVNSEMDRAYIIAAIECVEAVIIFDEPTPEALLEKVRPNILTKGGDYEKDEIVGKEYADDIKIIPYVSGYSSSNTISRVKECDIK